VHAWSQQKPSTQNPRPHSLFAVHLEPLALRPDWQVPAASQYWGRGQAGASGVPGTTFTQLPSLPGTLQLWQVPVQALLQQRPSTQRLLPHSLAAPQVPPFGFLFMAQAPEPLQ
jgi:hypothetical protein